MPPAVLGRALGRLWGRDVMLYTGGVSFFALLAAFPALALLIGLYALVFTPAEATVQAEALARMLPSAGRDLVQSELTNLTSAPLQGFYTKSALALLIGAYAAHRGFKALLAGLSFIHDEEEQQGFVRFNIMAFVVALAAFALATAVSGAILLVRLLQASAGDTLAMMRWNSDWLWSTLGLGLGLTCIYRYAMSHRRKVDWRASLIGGAAATGLSLIASWASAFYVDRVIHLGATYGSVTSAVVVLIWLSWNVNAVFFGGALATEAEIELTAKDPLPAQTDPSPVAP